MKSFIFSFILLLSTAVSALGETLPADSLHFSDNLVASDGQVSVNDTVALGRYDRRVHRLRKHWAALIPTHVLVQYAGNMGLVSTGAGWDFGRHRQWEADVLVGFLPKYNSRHSKLTMTAKVTFLPWDFYLRKGWIVEPLSCGLYANTVFGSEFWSRQPRRYPDKYYEFLSTKMRLNAFLGQRIGLTVPRNKRKMVKNVSAFYEVSTCDLYVRSLFQGNGVRFGDLLTLSLGLKFQIL